jgi:integrase/recombinase XerD
VQGLIKQYLSARGSDNIPELFVKVYKNGKKEVIHPATFNAWWTEMGGMLSEHEAKVVHINPHCFRHSRLENLSRQGIRIEKLKAYSLEAKKLLLFSLSDRNQKQFIHHFFGLAS